MLVLATTTNPGTASWTPLPGGSSSLIFAAANYSGSVILGDTTNYVNVTDGGVTIPANTLQDGDIIIVNMAWYITNYGNDPAKVFLGLTINGTQNTSPLTITAANTATNYTLLVQPYFLGLTSPDTITLRGLAIGVNASTGSIPAPSQVFFGPQGMRDDTQPTVFEPAFQMETANASADVAAGALSIQVFRPAT